MGVMVGVQLTPSHCCPARLDERSTLMGLVKETTDGEGGMINGVNGQLVDPGICEGDVDAGDNIVGLKLERMLESEVCDENVVGGRRGVWSFVVVPFLFPGASSNNLLLQGDFEESPRGELVD